MYNYFQQSQSRLKLSSLCYTSKLKGFPRLKFYIWCPMYCYHIPDRVGYKGVCSANIWLSRIKIQKKWIVSLYCQGLIKSNQSRKRIRI